MLWNIAVKQPSGNHFIVIYCPLWAFCVDFLIVNQVLWYLPSFLVGGMQWRESWCPSGLFFPCMVVNIDFIFSSWQALSNSSITLFAGCCLWYWCLCWVWWICIQTTCSRLASFGSSFLSCWVLSLINGEWTCYLLFLFCRGTFQVGCCDTAPECTTFWKHNGIWQCCFSSWKDMSVSQRQYKCTSGTSLCFFSWILICQCWQHFLPSV